MLPIHSLPIACATSLLLFNNMLPTQSTSCSLHNDYAPLFQISTFLDYSSSSHKHKKEKKKTFIETYQCLITSKWSCWILLLAIQTNYQNKIKLGLKGKISWALDVFTLGPTAHRLCIHY
jgi:hypothetical protein